MCIHLGEGTVALRPALDSGDEFEVFVSGDVCLVASGTLLPATLLHGYGT